MAATKASGDGRAEWGDLPDGLWAKVAEAVPSSDLLAFASACKQLRRAQVESGRKMVTKVKRRDLTDAGKAHAHAHTQTYPHTRTHGHTHTHMRTSSFLAERD